MEVITWSFTDSNYNDFFKDKNKEIKIINPATEEKIALITKGNKEDVDHAVISAKKAYQTWAFSKKEERIKLLEKLYENYKKRWADIADAITLSLIHI